MGKEQIMSSYIQKTLLLIFFILLSGASYTPAYATQDYEFLRNRVQNYQAFEAEELATYSSVESFIVQSQKEYAKSLQDFQFILFSERASIASPIDRKQVKINLNELRETIQDIIDKLLNAKEECLSRIEVLKSFEQLSASMPTGTPIELKKLYQESMRSVSDLRGKSKRQLSKINLLENEGNRIIGRIDKLEQGEKHNLLQLWRSYLLTGKAPLFSSDFWNKSFVYKNWLKLRKSEFNSGIIKYKDNSLKHLSIFAAVLFFGLTLQKIIRKKVTWRYSILNSQLKIKVLSLVALISFSFYIATRIVFPSAMESLAYLAFSVFFFAILKLTKYICRDRYLITSGRLRTAILFTVSVLLIALNVPSKWVTIIFLSFLILAWFTSSITAWRKNRFKGLIESAKKSSFLSPLIVVTFFGFGRLACLLAIIWSLSVFIRSFGRLWGQILFGSTEKGEKLLRGLVSGLAVPLGWGISFAIAYYWLTGFFGENTITTALTRQITIQSYSISIGSIVSLAVLFFLTKSCVAAFNVSIEHVGSKWPKGKRGAVPSMQTLFTYGVWSLFTIISMRALGLNLTSIAVIAGGLSVGIGFGLQNIVNNFISGLILLFGRSIQQGDVIELEGLWCTVQKINIRTTLVETFENAVIMIPNSDLVTTQMTNWTKNSSILRRDILVGVAYGSDTEKVRQTLLEVASDNSHVLDIPEPYVHFSNFGSSSLDFILRVWIDDIDYAIRAMSELRFEIDNSFRKEGIEIAFPQLDIHVKSMPEFKETKKNNT